MIGFGATARGAVTALNALGALVVGLGTNAQTNIDPRQGLESFARLTGAINRSSVTIPNGTLTPIAPGDPLYFQISSGFGASVANGITTAIQNAVSAVDVNLTVRASDPTVDISPELAQEKGIKNLDWCRISSPRTQIRAKALVTRRMRPFTIDGKVIHQVGMPWHWGYEGLSTGDVVNELTSLIADPNVSMHEGKAFVCNVESTR